MRYEFKIEKNGVTSNCKREVTGKKVLRQRIHVIGVGSKEDSASYGGHYHPISSMEGIARIIASEIVGK